MIFPRIILSLLFIITLSPSIQCQTLFNANWQEITFPGGRPFSMFYDKQNENLFVAGYGDLYKMDLNSMVWTLVDADSNSGILANSKIISICKSSSGSFFVGCDNNTQSYYSIDDGKTWDAINDIKFTLNSVFCIKEGPDSKIWFGTNNGLIVSPDNGSTYQDVPNMKRSINKIAFAPNGNMFVGTSGGLFLSTNNGESWTQMNLQFKGSVVTGIGFNSKGDIYAGSNTYLYRSTNGGNSWQSITPTGLTSSYAIGLDLFISDDDILFYVIQQALFVTHDYCNTWYYAEPWISYPDFMMQPKSIIIDTKSRIFAINKETSKLPYFAMGRFNPTSVESIGIPITYHLFQNYPNPFNPGTVICYQLAVGCHVQLKVYDPLGREVATLVDEYKPAGNYNYTFTIINYALPSGVYFYTLKAGDYFSTKKMVVLK